MMRNSRRRPHSQCGFPAAAAAACRGRSRMASTFYMYATAALCMVMSGSSTTFASAADTIDIPTAGQPVFVGGGPGPLRGRSSGVTATTTRSGRPITHNYIGSRRWYRSLDAEVRSSANGRTNDTPGGGSSSSTTSSSSNNSNLQEGEMHAFLSVSVAFRSAFGVLIVIILCLQAYLLAMVIKHRKKPAMQLAQASVLAVFVASGMVGVLGTYLLIPLPDPGCAFKEPTIMTALSLAGSILAGRAWRISNLMSPMLLSMGGVSSMAVGGGKSTNSASTSSLTSEDSEKWKCWIQWEDRVTNLKNHLMVSLTHASDYKRLRHCFSRDADEIARRRRADDSIRRRVPVSRLLWLVFVLMIPQLLLQLTNLTVPAMRESRTVSVMTLDSLLHVNDSGMYSIGNDIQRGQDAGVAYYKCSRQLGAWPTVIGSILVIVPYVLTLLLSSYSDNLPEVFNEKKAILASFKIFLIDAAVACPSLAMAVQADTKTYLAACIVLGAILPPLWLVVWKKLKPVLSGESVVVVNNLLLRRAVTPSNRDGDDSSIGEIGDDSSANIDQNNRKRQEEMQQKCAQNALNVGKMYEDMNEPKKAVKLYDEALVMWKYEHDRDQKDIIGGYTAEEVKYLTPKDLELVMKLLMAKGRVAGASGTDGTNTAARCWTGALDIFTKAPANRKIKDRTIIFPAFSGVFTFLKTGKIEDIDGKVETDLVSRFVRETKMNGDPVHYGRALAMKAEVAAKLGDFTKALEAFDEMRGIYVFEKHSDAIAKAYMVDRCAQTFALSAVWLQHKGKIKAATEMCSHVINEILPKLDPANVNGLFLTLMPVIFVLKWRGEAKKMRQLFEKYVEQNFMKHFGKDGKSPCKPAIRPMLLLLMICDDEDKYPNMDEDIAWILTEEGGVLPNMADKVYTAFCWSTRTMTAEICLHLANRLENGQDRSKLIEKGIRMVREGTKRMTSKDGEIRFPIPYKLHVLIAKKLEVLAKKSGIDIPEEEEESVEPGKASLKSLIKAPATSISKRVSFSESVMLAASRTVDNKTDPAPIGEVVEKTLGMNSQLSELSLGSLVSDKEEIGENDDATLNEAGDIGLALNSSISDDIPPAAAANIDESKDQDDEIND